MALNRNATDASNPELWDAIYVHFEGAINPVTIVLSCKILEFAGHNFGKMFIGELRFAKKMRLFSYPPGTGSAWLYAICTMVSATDAPSTSP